MAEEKAVDIFREYLRINTMHPEPNYASAIKFLKRIADEISLPYEIVEVVPKNPILLITWKGSDPSLPTVLLNSHMDVVPVFTEYWKYDPFSATMEENGDIYARGTQDMKSVGIQYLEAIRILKAENFQPLRTIILSFVPDEEVGGVRGVKPFVKTTEFRKLNVGFSLDEGMASPTDTYVVYYGERSRYVVDVTAVGNPGHGSQFIKHTASQKLLKFMEKFEEFRNKEQLKLASDPKLHLGDVTTTNLTMLNGGVQNNVVPAKIRAEFDCRVATTFPAEVFRLSLFNKITIIKSIIY
ncbi:adenylate cyclase [Chamberlinius hualienensis]